MQFLRLLKCNLDYQSLVDNIFVVKAGKVVFKQTIGIPMGIPMGTNCSPLLPIVADIFLYS